MNGVKQANPCTDCNAFYPYYVMQFDHTGSDKESNVSDMANRSLSLARTKNEIAKCELVCANCHAVRTWERQQPA